VVSVAQLVEHRSVAPRVVGSNPIAHPNSPHHPQGFALVLIVRLTKFSISRHTDIVTFLRRVTPASLLALHRTNLIINALTAGIGIAPITPDKHLEIRDSNRPMPGCRVATPGEAT
jgi:hypothetical protein